MKIYTIIGGVNGAGKSSLTGALKSERSDLGLIIDVDKLAFQLKSNIEGGKLAIKKIADSIERGLSFTQETTLAGVRTQKTAIRAREQGYYIKLYYIGLDTASESIKRIQNRVEKGGHNIPTEDVNRRFASRFEALTRILPYCDEATFFDNDNGFVEVAEYKNGEIVTKGEHLPQWLIDLMEFANR